MIPDGDEPVRVVDMCCGSGCEPCVWDLYQEAKLEYQKKLAEWKARQQAKAN